MKKEWIGKLGNSVYKIEIDDACIYPQGVEVNMKFMDHSFWVDGYSKQAIAKGKSDLRTFIERLDEVYNYLSTFNWDESKEAEFNKGLKAKKSKKSSQTKKDV